MRFLRVFVCGMLLLSSAVSVGLAGEEPGDIRLDVKTFTLENGMLFLVVERPATPQVACRISIRAGSALEESGKTGIAHLLEHMMFKGTKNFGTLDAEKDRALQEKIEAAYQVILREERKRDPDRALIASKLAEMDALRREVQEIYVPQAFSSQLGRNGAVGVNAFTTQDETQYMASVPADMLEQWFSLIGEQLFEPSWREFYVEKEVVQREWAFRYINNPEGAAWLDLQTTAYTAHPYRNPTIGWKADMERYSTRDAMAFHGKYYHPANAVCVLVGDVTAEEARSLAEVYFARYPAGERAPERLTEEPSQQGPRRSLHYLKGARTPLVRIGFHGASMGTEDFFALDVLTMILSHGRGARMTQNVVNKGLAVEAWAYNPDNRYGGMVILGGSPNEPAGSGSGAAADEEALRQAYRGACEELEDILLAEIERLKHAPVSERELARIKKLNQRDFLDRMRSNEDLAGLLATLEVQVGWSYLMGYLQEIARVTPEDVQRVARNYLREENRNTVFVIPGGDPDRPPESYTEVRSVGGAQAARAVRPEDFSNHSAYPTPEGWKHPLSFRRSPEKLTYPEAARTTVEGATVFYLPDRELPLIDLVLMVKAGSVDTAEDKTGLAALLGGTIVRGGTAEHPPGELALILDENAIRLSVSVGEEDSEVRLSVMKEDWDKGLSLLQEVLAGPAFDSKVFEVVRQQALTALKRQGEDAQSVAGREAMIWHFQDHPYGRDPLKGLETLPRITREDLKAFLKTYFVPSNMVVAVAGDIDQAAVTQGLEGLFKALPGTQAPERRIEDPGPTPPVLTLVHKPGQVQSQVNLILPGFKRTHPDYWKAGLLASILGGSDSLMYTRLRDDLGLVYSAWFFQTYKWQAGLLMGYIGCKADKTGQAIEETVRIMEGLRREVPEWDLEQKRLDALNSFVFNVDTPAALAEVYARYHMRGESLDTLEKIQEDYMEATEQELRDLAQELLNPEALQIIVVADKTIPVRGADGSERTLEEDLKALAKALDLPFREEALR